MDAGTASTSRPAARPGARRRSLVVRTLGAASCAALVALGAVDARASDGVTVTSVDASGYPTVLLDVEAPVGTAPFEPSEVTVTENGAPVAATVRRIADDGLEVVLLVDTSGSMIGAPMAQTRAAVSEFLERLPDEVRIGLVAFGDQVQVVSTPTTDRASVAAAVGRLKADGETRLYDAIVAARALFSPGARERVLVLLSDGGDTVSRAPIDVAAAAVVGLRVEVVSLETETTNHLALARFAIDGRGRVVPAANPDGLVVAYGAIAQSLLNRYQISYPSSARGPATVRVVTPLGATESSVALPAPEAAPAPSAPAPAATIAAPAPSTAAVAPAVSVPATQAATAPVTTAPAASPARPRDGTDWRLAGAAALAGGLATGVVFGVSTALARRRRDRRPVRPETSVALALPVTASSLVVPSAPTPSRWPDERRRARPARRRAGPLADRLAIAGVRLRPLDFVAVVASLATLALLAGRAAAGWWHGAVAAATIVVAAALAIEVVCRRRRARFAEHLPGVLPLLANSLRAGLGLGAAVEAVAHHAPEPVARELRSVAATARRGRDAGDALERLARRMRSDDLQMVVVAVRLHRAVGGDLAATVASAYGAREAR